jgi:hypothetical protein
MNSERPEHALLRCIARRELASTHAARLPELVSDNLDWDYLLNTAIDHGLLPLVHKHLHQQALHPIPVAIQTRLKRESVENSQAVLRLTGRLLEIHRVFAENGIPVASFKGALLSQLAYGEIGLRQAGDIDIMVARDQVEPARRSLASLGYQMSRALTTAQFSSHTRFHCEMTFTRDDQLTIIDLHWGLAPRSFVFNLEPGEVLSRLESVSLAGTQIETFATEDLVLYLAMHGAKHLWQSLEWIASLGEVLQASPALNWAKLLERATRARATRMLALGLRLVESHFEFEFPANLFDTLDAEEEMKRLAGVIQAELFAKRDLPVSSETNLYNFKIMDRKRDAITSMLRAIFVPTLSDWEALTLPVTLHPLYYAYRPLRLSKEYGASLWQRFSR